MRAPLLIALTLLAAGCVAPTDGDEDDGGPGVIAPGDVSWAARAVPSDDSHDHGDATQHANLSSPNFQVVGWDPLVSDAFGGTPGGFFCGGAGTTAEGRRIAVVHSFDAATDVAFVVMDVTDPAAPAKIGEYLLDRAHIYDATISLDGRFAVLGANPDVSVPVFGGVQVVQPRFRDACTGVVRAAGPEEAIPLSPGVILVDLADPTNPSFADFAPTPALGPHSVHAGKVGDANVFLASITNLEHQASYFQFYGVEELPVVGPKLTLLSTFQGPPGPDDPAVPLINGHVDGYIAEHPGTGQTLAYLAKWDAGMTILDISNPRVPLPIGHWGGAEQGFMGAPASVGDENLGGIHGTFPIPVLWGDKHYTLAGQELGGRPENRPTGWVFVIDTTDPANPVEVGRWTLPVDVEWSEFLLFSTHYFTVVDRTLFVSLYHGGVWAVDVSDDALASPRTIGVWVPDRVSPSPPAPAAGLGSADMVLDVVPLEDGTLLAWGSLSGAYLLRFDATRPMEAPPAWDTEADPGDAQSPVQQRPNRSVPGLRPMSRVALSIVLVSLAIAGCVAPATNVDPQEEVASDVADGWWTNALPSSLTHEDHDHADRSQHAGITTPNFEVLGWDPLLTETYGTTLTGMGCGGTVTRTDGMRLAVVHSISTDVSFVVADVTDPAAPKMLGEFYLPNAVVWDADISADGMHVLIGAYPPIFGDPTPVLPIPPVLSAPAWATSELGMIQFRNACTGEVKAVGPPNYLPGPAIVMAGIQDPMDPVFETYVPQPVIGPHSVGSQMIGDTVFATSSVTNLVHSGSYYTIFTIEADQLVPYTAIQTPGVVGPFELNGHTDVFLAEHPVTGVLLAHLANWNGYYVYDISVPGAALEVGSWFDAGSVHTTYPFPTQIDDKVYIVVGQEVGEPEELPSGWVYILDITDPAAPNEVGRWTLPVKPKWDDGGLQFSPHYVAILNQTMFVSNYHGGLWAVDITDLSAPAAIGIFVPENESSAPFGGAEGYGPGIEDVIVDPTTGLLTTWDGAGGVYVLRFHEEMPKVHAPRWPGSEPGGE